MRKVTVGLVAFAAIAAPLALAAPANAADGEQFIVNGNFSTYGADGSLTTPGTTTDFKLGLPGGYNPGNGSMYDPGRYIIASNPASVHEAWATFPEGDPMLIANGFESTNQKVWSQTITPESCTTPGSKITFDFTANATNILTPEWVAANAPGGVPGANISVTVNGTTIGSQDLTTVNPGNLVQFVGSVPAAPVMEVTVWNNGTAYLGNDFAIDDISLIQRGSCEPPCETTVNGVWFNYTGKYTGTGTPPLNDPKWHALPAQPGGEHDLAVRGFDQPYNPGADKGKGDWFVWKDLGTTCPA